VAVLAIDLGGLGQDLAGRELARGALHGELLFGRR
jgi:hypothetical protein